MQEHCQVAYEIPDLEGGYEIDGDMVDVTQELMLQDEANEADLKQFNDELDIQIREAISAVKRSTVEEVAVSEEAVAAAEHSTLQSDKTEDRAESEEDGSTQAEDNRHADRSLA